MDFIERLFQFSPDGGSGMTELVCLALLVFFACGVLFRRQVRKAWSQVSRLIS